MQDIVCHIGYPKTGTTYLQKEVFPNIEGINYINDSKTKYLFHDVIEKDDSFYDKDKIERELMKMHKPGEDMLLSYEPLTGHHIKTEFPNRSQIARRLKLAGVTKIIITIRNQIDALESSYKQYIKSGGVLELSKFFDLGENPYPFLYIEYFNYYKIVELYSEIFGTQNVLLLQFEQIFSRNGEFENQISSFLKVKKTDFNYSLDRITNKSLSNFSAKTLRIINHLTYSSYRPSNLISKKLSSFFFYKILMRVDGFKDEKRMIAIYENEILSHFSGSNASLEAVYNITLHEKYGLKT